MTEQNPVPLIVLSPTRDAVEAINSILRRAGHPVHCTWIPALRDLPDALPQINPELLIFVPAPEDDLESVIEIRDQAAPTVPVMLVTEGVDEEVIANAMTAGARDVVSLTSPVRLAAVMVRELRAFRLERALTSTLKSAHDARNQLESVLQRSNDAIVQVQEGIVIDANPAWLELFGVKDSLVGQPVMDLFDEATQPALKGALAACLQGRWNDLALKATALLPDGKTMAVEIVLALGHHDGEPSVRLVVPAKARDEQNLVEELSHAVHSDHTTGFLHRRELMEALHARLEAPSPGGMRCLALVKLDAFAAVERDVGATASEDVLMGIAALLKETLLSQRDCRALRRCEIPGVTRARQRERYPGVGQATSGARAEARHACQREDGRGHLHGGPVHRASQRSQARRHRGRRHRGLRQGHQAGRQPGVDIRTSRRRQPRPVVRSGLGQAHQGRPDGEPLPPGAAADGEPAGRRSDHV